MGTKTTASSRDGSLGSELFRRTKTLGAVYKIIGIAEIPELTADRLLKALIRTIPEGLRYPDKTSVRISVNGTTVTGKSFTESDMVIHEPISADDSSAGYIQIYRLPETHEPFSEEEKNFIGVASKIAGKIIERMAIDKALLAKNLAFGASLSADIIFEVDGTIADVNKHALELWGAADSSEIIGKPVTSFLFDKFTEETMMAGLVRSGVWKNYITARRKNESGFPAYVLAGEVRNKKKEVIFYQASIIDASEEVTLKKKVSAQLELDALLSKITADFISIPYNHLEKAINDAIAKVCVFFNIDMSAVYEPSTSKDGTLKLTFLYSNREIPPVYDNFIASTYYPWCEKTLLSGQNVVVSSMDFLPADAAVDKQTWSYYGVRSSLIFPLSSNKEEFLGTMSFDIMSEEREWDPQNVEQLKFVSQIIANAFSRKKLESSLAEKNSKLAERLEQTIQAISKIGELRDVYTSGHQKNVQVLACAIAQEMGLLPEQISNIKYAALIHDIGKIYIPTDILNKPGRLTRLEFEIIKTHVEHGYDVVKNIDFPPEVSLMVLQHHERLDGSGYPKGLKDNEIIVESQILAVADVVEAMSSHRPYRPALGIGAALEELNSGKGVKYSGAAVDACCKLFKEKGFAFK